MAGADEDEWVVVGRVGPPHGVTGAVLVHPFTDAPDERFAPGAVLSTAGELSTSTAGEPSTAGELSTAGESGAGGALTVAAMRWQGKRLVVEFAGIGDRAAAEALRGTELLVPAGSRPVLDDPDEFYDSDLIGLTARTVDGAPLGPVRDVVHAPGGDQLVLEVDGRERLVPFVAAIVLTVDVAGGLVVLDPPEGLFDL